MSTMDEELRELLPQVGSLDQVPSKEKNQSLGRGCRLQV